VELAHFAGAVSRACPDPSCATVESVICTAELERRPPRPPDFAGESRALAALVEAMSSAGSHADGVLQQLAEAALVLCRAHSAGVCVLEDNDGNEVTRWRAAAGAWERFLGTDVPRGGCFCCAALERGTPLLMQHPERHFPRIEKAPPLVEVLMVPFYAAGTAVGTVWVGAHDEARHFDAEDLRLLMRLSRFAATAYQLLTTRQLRAELTAERAQEARLSADLDALLAAARRKDEFLATLAHELRSPLAAIRHAAHYLELRVPATADLQWAGGVIDRQIRQMSRLVEDLLDVARIAHDRLELRKECCDLAMAVQTAVETCRPVIEQQRQEFTLTLPEEPFAVDADPARLAQVFANLLINAAKYSEPGGRIEVALRRDGNDVVVAVRDHGIGIAPDLLARVFEPFHQIRSSQERSLGGLGIGLTLVKRLVELHGGSVSAHSEGIGHGCEFAVRLPLLAQPLPRPPALDGLPPAHAAERRRVLVVDDHEDTAEALSRLLQALGYETHTVNDGAAALAAAGEIKPDVALLDIGMLSMSGHELARCIRTQHWGKDALLIAVSGWGQEEDRRRAAEAGFDHHVVKPVDFDSLAALIAGRARSSAAQDGAARRR
jgi:signal transduction histidine kinase/CheY-like chemotaxis protein